MKLKCVQCGDILEALTNGYNFGDRLMEGVMFVIKVKGKKLYSDGVDKTSSSYFEDFNKKKWLKTAGDYVNRLLKRGSLDVLVCANDGEEVNVCNDDDTLYTGAVIKVPLKMVGHDDKD